MRRARCVFLSMVAWLAGIVTAGAQAPDTSRTPAAQAPVAPQAVPSPAPPLIPGPPAHVRPDDKRRTLRSYGHNLGYNFLSVLQHENHKPLLISAGLTGYSFLFDHDAEQYFIDHPHDDFGKIGASIGGSVAVGALTVGLFSAGRISRGDSFRSASYDLSQAIIVSQVYVQALKLVTQRERPDQSNKMSFPSGHAANGFTIAAVISRHYRKLAIPSYALATYIAVSRMAANKHHFSDIVAGGGLGWTIGRSVVRRNSRPPDVKLPKTEEAPREKTTFQVTPWAGPSGDGRGLALTVRF